MKLSWFQIMAIVCLLAVGFLTAAPFVLTTEAQVSETCLQAMQVESDAYDWVMYACWRAFYDDSWDNECVNANIALASAISYRQAVCDS